MSDKEIKEWLIGLFLFGVFLATASIFTENKLELVKGVLDSKPKYVKIYKGNKYEFSILEDTINKYDLRYVFSDLTLNQKEVIKNKIEIGDSIEMHIDRDDDYGNSFEIYSLKINGNDIYKMNEFKQLKKREMLGSFGLIISSIIGWILFVFTKFKRRNLFIFGFQFLGLLAFISYLLKG